MAPRGLSLGVSTARLELPVHADTENAIYGNFYDSLASRRTGVCTRDEVTSSSI